MASHAYYGGPKGVRKVSTKGCGLVILRVILGREGQMVLGSVILRIL